MSRHLLLFIKIRQLDFFSDRKRFLIVLSKLKYGRERKGNVPEIDNNRRIFLEVPHFLSGLSLLKCPERNVTSILQVVPGNLEIKIS